MPVSVLLLPVLAAAAQASVPPSNVVTVTGRGGIPFISPMGEPIRARTVGEDTLARWFAQADRNHDAFLTPDEMVADAERFFAVLDTNHDGQIDPDELIHYEWKVAPEIQVNSRMRRARTPAEIAADENRHHGEDSEADADKASRRKRMDQVDDGPQGAARYALLNLPEPVAAADADLNRAISLDEFRQAARERFALLDRSHAGRLTVAGLEALLPVLPAPGHHRKRKDNEPDTRIGVPLPPGN